jgi:hypothetical protein
MPLDERRLRGRAVLIALLAIAVVESILLAIFAALAFEDGRGAGFMASMIGAAGGIIFWKGWPALEELEGTRMVLRASSRIFHVIEYGMGVAGIGLAIAADLAFRTVGFALPWPFPLGTVAVLGVPLGALGTFVIAPLLARWIGIGVPRR